MVVQHNISAMNSQRNLKLNQNKMSGNIEKLSSGYKINRAGDDAAGLAISEKMRNTITGLKQGTKNAEDGVSLVRTGEGALDEIHAMLNRMKELSVQSANGTYDDAVDRNALQKEVSALVTEVDRIVESTNFNGIPLLCREDIEFHETIPVITLVNSYSDYNSVVEASGGNVTKADGSVVSGSSYVCSDISVPSQALSVPSSASLPYEITMNICVYDDVNSTENNSVFTNKTVKLTVSDDGNGGVNVIGQTGTFGSSGSFSPSSTIDFTNRVLKTNYDVAQGNFGLPYVGGTDGYHIDSSQMEMIMEELLNGMPCGLSAGGDLATSWTSLYHQSPSSYPEITYDKSNGSYTFLPGKSYSDYFAAEDIFLVSGSYDSAYGNNMNIYGSYSDPTNTGRVVGVEVDVKAGSSSIASSDTPAGFDHTQWTSSSNMLNLSSGAILGVDSVAEPSHTEVKIGDTFYNSSQVLGLSSSQRNAMIISIDKVTEETYLDGELESSDFETFKYAIVIKPVNAAVEAAFGSDVTVVWVDEDTGNEHKYVEELCDQMQSDLGVDVNRKLDNVNDVFLDKNVNNKFTIQVQTFTSEKNYKETIDEIVATFYKPNPIILQVGDQNEEFDRYTILIRNMREDVEDLMKVDVSAQEMAAKSIDIINDTINTVSTVRADLGAYDNRLQHTINKNRLTTENLQEAESIIRDADMAEEMMEYTKNNILIQSAQSMLAHSMQQPEGILQLLG